jgi:hypothetical protein
MNYDKTPAGGKIKARQTPRLPGFIAYPKTCLSVF